MFVFNVKNNKIPVPENICEIKSVKNIKISNTRADILMPEPTSEQIKSVYFYPMAKSQKNKTEN